MIKKIECLYSEKNLSHESSYEDTYIHTIHILSIQYIFLHVYVYIHLVYTHTNTYIHTDMIQIFSEENSLKLFSRQSF